MTLPKTRVQSGPEAASATGWSRLAGALAGFMAHLAFPRGCAGCDAPLAVQAAFCAPCAAGVALLARTPTSLADGGVAAAASYGGPLAQALHRLKYGGRVDVAPQLGGLLARAVAGSRFDLVVPVPLHPTRLAERGFNQAALLGRSIEVGARFAPTLLVRLRPTPQQTRLARAERAINVAGAFQARSNEVAGARVLLVDDVVTTGATLAACRAALREAGAVSVSAVVVARAE